mmetsp:Transcript_15824/g.32061  ORF Transcript_15824/g.32061 Transcript_15824/m.32061 type:complete len:255 (+) Transcript_15824:96-860(+)
MSESTVRAAVALNNTGVSLMERGRVCRALRLFKNVTILLKKPHEVSREQIQDDLRQAEILIASVKESERACLIDIVAMDDDDDTAKQDAILYGSSSSVLFPIRLRQTLMHTSLSSPSSGESNESAALANFVGIQYITAVVLYNFGLASRYCAVRHPKRRDFVTGAEQTLRSAKWMLIKSADKVPDNLYELYRWDLMIKLVHLSLEQRTRFKRNEVEDHHEQEGVHGQQQSLIPNEEATYVQQVCRRVRTFAAAA